MKQILIATITAALLVGTAFAGASILANGEVEIAACTAGSTNTATIGLYNNTGLEFGEVLGVRIKNNTDFTTVSTIKAIDLDDEETVTTVTAASNAVVYSAAYGTTYAVTASNVVPTTTVPQCAKELQISIAISTNDADSTVEYYIYGR